MESEDDIQPLIYTEVEVQSQGEQEGPFLGLSTQALNTDPDLEQVKYISLYLYRHDDG